MSENINFDAAYLELQTIQAKIQGEDVSVEELSTLIKRGSELIQLCKTRLRSIEEDIDKAFSED
jgi:exodeoxyribonuclease VII small subunit